MARVWTPNMVEAAKLLFDRNAGVAFLARVDCHLAALESDNARSHFLDVQLVAWLRKVPTTNAFVTREVVKGLVKRRRQLLEETDAARTYQ